MKTNKIANPVTDDPFIDPEADIVTSVESEDLSRFEGEGGLEAPASATELTGLHLKTLSLGNRPEGKQSEGWAAENQRIRTP